MPEVYFKKDAFEEAHLPNSAFNQWYLCEYCDFDICQIKPIPNKDVNCQCCKLNHSAKEPDDNSVNK
jgi:hypothetical protein